MAPQTHVHQPPADFDDDMGWLKRAAPQFHTQPDSLPQVYTSGRAARREDDSDSDASGSESDCSDSSDEEDPMHPYNVQDTTQTWHNDGQGVFIGDGGVQAD